ncbi:MAG: hypothetical protein JNL98_17330 [Bryobacterales bacterium]|nr:hypothetical protein [Bryobacterales bacterium]
MRNAIRRLGCLVMVLGSLDGPGGSLAQEPAVPAEEPGVGVKRPFGRKPAVDPMPKEGITEKGEPGREAALSSPLPFVPVTPCRVVDTRPGQGKTGSFGPPMPLGGSTRTVPVPAAGCGIPATAVAYSLNITVVPVGPLSYLAVWPAGSPQPNVSTLNSFEGRVVANAALVPAGTGGAINFFVTNPTEVIIDINGYFGATGQPVQLYSVSPCRIVDTRAGEGKTGQFGPPVLAAGTARDVPVPSGTCGIPATARAYSLNVTVVPRGPLSFLTVWPTGLARPAVSTLNSFDGRIVANAALVPAGTNGSISVFVTDTADVIIDINGYLAP